MAERDNVLPFRRAEYDQDAPLEGDFFAVEDVRDLVSLMSDSRGAMSLVFTPVPSGSRAFEIREADDADRLALHIVRLGQRMRQGGSPP